MLLFRYSETDERENLMAETYPTAEHRELAESTDELAAAARALAKHVSALSGLSPGVLEELGGFSGTQSDTSVQKP